MFLQTTVLVQVELGHILEQHQQVVVIHAALAGDAL
jgi:hypothetical protein